MLGKYTWLILLMLLITVLCGCSALSPPAEFRLLLTSHLQGKLGPCG